MADEQSTERFGIYRNGVRIGSFNGTIAAALGFVAEHFGEGCAVTHDDPDFDDDGTGFRAGEDDLT